MLDLASGTRRTVVESTAPDFLEHVRWSPDGTSLVVEEQRYPSDQPLPVVGAGPQYVGSAIGIADISGPGVATPRFLTDWDMLAAYPDWNRSDGRIIFTTYDLSYWETSDQPSNLYTIKPDGTELTQLTHYGPSQIRDTQPTWTPDGKRIIFTQVGTRPLQRLPRAPEVAFMDPDGTSLQVIGHRRDALEAAPDAIAAAGYEIGSHATSAMTKMEPRVQSFTPYQTRATVGLPERGGRMQQELVRRAQSGDHDAFCALVRSALSRLVATARLILRDQDRAEDAVQDALIEAWRDIRGLRDPERLDAWLHRLLVRSCYRAARRERRRDVVEIAVSADDDAPAPDLTGSIAERDRVDRAFRKLTQDQRAVLVLFYYADLPLADVAAALDIPLGTTKSRLSRATDALRAVLEADERTPELVNGQTR